MLGTDFISDVLLVRLKVEPPATLQPQYLATHIALRSVAEAMTIASAHLLDIEATELQAEYRPALTPLGPLGLEAEIYLYDTLAGGAGLHAADPRLRPGHLQAHPGPAGELPRRLRRVLLPVPAQLPEPVRARAARPARRRQPAALPAVTAHCPRWTRPACHARRTGCTRTWPASASPASPSPGTRWSTSRASDRSSAPILATRGGQQWIIGVHGPLTRDVAPDAKLQEAKEFSTSVRVLLIDDTEITHSLPSASQRVIRELA